MRWTMSDVGQTMKITNLQESWEMGDTMSIPFHLHTCNLWSGKKKIKNPFIKEEMRESGDLGLTDSDKKAAKELLDHLHGIDLGPELREIKNFLTKEDMEVSDDPGLTDSEKEAVKELLDQFKS